MNWLNAILILSVAYGAVFFESWFGGFRHLLGTQIDFLPSLMVYAGLTNGLFTVGLAALVGGLWFDSLSANPLGVSVLPLFLIGSVAYQGRDLLARDDRFAQFGLGMAASAFQPLAVLFILLNIGALPLLGWMSVWQWIVMTVGGGAFAPLCFILFKRFHRAFEYPPAPQAPFRQDRQIKRGRI